MPLIGTAGHVDHGKTTLIKALTGIDTDRLPEEKSRGLTIDLGFAWLDIPEVGRVSFVDVPGHERFLSNMLAGVGQVDVALLCVAADQGIMPQTREHFQIIHLLGVKSLVVALTRADLADEDMKELVRQEVTDLTRAYSGCPIVETSATTGQGIDELRQALKGAILPIEKKVGLWYLPIDRVFTKTGFGTIITGSLCGGDIDHQTEAFILPQGRKVSIRTMNVHGEPVDHALVGSRVALNLRGIEPEELSRGMVACQDGASLTTNCIDIRAEIVNPIRHAHPVRIAIGTDEVLGKAFLSDHDSSLIQLRTDRPTVASKGQSLIIRNASPPTLLGGGKVLAPLARKRRKSALPEVGGDLVSTLQSSPNGLTTAMLARQLGTTESALAGDIERARLAGAIIGFGGIWLTMDDYMALVERLRSELQSLHDAHPEKLFITKSAIEQKLNLNWPTKAWDRLIARLVEESLLRSGSAGVALDSHEPQLKPRQAELLKRLVNHLLSQEINVSNPRELHLQLNIPQPAVEEILRIGVDAGLIVRIAPDIFYPKSTIERVISQVRSTFKKPFPASDFKNEFATSRKYAIPLLEYLDAQGVTIRHGDVRSVKAAI